MKSKEDAIEAWNTWAGRYKDIDPENFCSINPCNYCAKIIDEEGKYCPPSSVLEMVGHSQMHLNGAVIVPWPKLDKLQSEYANSYFAISGIEKVFALRSRWCALFRDVLDYREKIVLLLKNNDRENDLLNYTLHKWNETLNARGFHPFEDNDLRGINIAGLRLNGKDYDGIFLRKIDFSFSEMTATDLTGANLYGTKFHGASGFSTKFNFCICESSDFSNSTFPRSKFNGSILSFANFDSSGFSDSVFNGSELEGASFKSARVRNSSFCNLDQVTDGIKNTKKININKIEFNDGSDFSDSLFDKTALEKNKNLNNFISTNRHDKKLFSRIFESLEIKPGAFGFRIDLKKIFKK